MTFNDYREAQRIDQKRLREAYDMGYKAGIEEGRQQAIDEITEYYKGHEQEVNTGR